MAAVVAGSSSNGSPVPALAALADPEVLKKFGHLTVRQFLQLHSQQQVERVKAHAEGLIAKLQTDRAAVETEIAVWYNTWQQLQQLNGSGAKQL